MITLIKIGGSLITNKTEKASFYAERMHSLSTQINKLYKNKLFQQCIIGHGSGSFGHFEAHTYKTHQGVYTPNDWYGYAQVAHAVSTLNHHVMHILAEDKLPVMHFQPSASAHTAHGEIIEMNVENIKNALQRGLIPVVYGDVAFDDAIGGAIISTETIFIYLIKHLPVSRIVLLGEVDGVYDQHGATIPKITPDSLPGIQSALGGSAGVDVTGGMLSKVSDMLEVVMNQPNLQVHIINGLVEDNLYRCISQPDKPIGTLITNG